MDPQLTLAIGTPGAAYTVTGPNGFTDQGTVDSTGVAQSDLFYAPGDYFVTWSYQGTTRTDPLTVSVLSSPVQSFEPLDVPDPGAGQLTPAPPVSTPVPAEDTAPDYPFEWAAYNAGKYFTPTQAFLYIGDLYIDELTGFHYTLQANRVPVFGYASELMDAVGRGKSLIQGQFFINFVSEGYLYTVLDQYARRCATPRAADEQAALDLSRQLSLLQSDPNPLVEKQAAALKQQLRTLIGSNSDLTGVIASAQKSSSTSYNAVYQRIPFDIVMTFEGGGRTVTRRIEKCILTSNDMALGEQDGVVLDLYSFMARRCS